MLKKSLLAAVAVAAMLGGVAAEAEEEGVFQVGDLHMHRRREIPPLDGAKPAEGLHKHIVASSISFWVFMFWK